MEEVENGVRNSVQDRAGRAEVVDEGPDGSPPRSNFWTRQEREEEELRQLEEERQEEELEAQFSWEFDASSDEDTADVCADNYLRTCGRRLREVLELDELERVLEDKRERCR